MHTQDIYSLAQDETQINSWELMLLTAAKKISLSEPQYTEIEKRYARLEEILNKSQDPCLSNAHIFIQGSISTKTAIKPAPEAKDDMATIDADALILLPNASNYGSAYTLQAVESLFEKENLTKQKIKQLRRGIRVRYADESPGFHIDITPAIKDPNNIEADGYGHLLVPDREDGWKASAPRSYASWLEDASKNKINLIFKSTYSFDGMESLNEARQDPLPEYKDYSISNPLAATVKLLKRHRDLWAIRTSNESNRPISAIISTLASQAYIDIATKSQSRPLRPLEAMISIISSMRNYIIREHDFYYVKNPCHQNENFAEKWNRYDGESYVNSFMQWHAAILTDIVLGLTDWGNQEEFESQFNLKFGVPKNIVHEIVREKIKGNWTLPGRSKGVNSNVLLTSSLGLISTEANSNTKVVGRLG